MELLGFGLSHHTEGVANVRDTYRITDILEYQYQLLIKTFIT